MAEERLAPDEVRHLVAMLVRDHGTRPEEDGHARGENDPVGHLDVLVHREAEPARETSSGANGLRGQREVQRPRVPEAPVMRGITRARAGHLVEEEDDAGLAHQTVEHTIPGGNGPRRAPEHHGWTSVQPVRGQVFRDKRRGGNDIVVQKEHQRGTHGGQGPVASGSGAVGGTLQDGELRARGQAGNRSAFPFGGTIDGDDDLELRIGQFLRVEGLQHAAECGYPVSSRDDDGQVHETDPSARSAGGREMKSGEPCLLMVAPQGLTVTGVTTWALSLTEALTARGIRCGLVVHGCAPGFAEVEAEVASGVRVYRPTELPAIEHARGDVGPFAEAYAAAARDLSGASGVACIVPARHGDCFGASLRAGHMLGARARVIGWQQNDSAYEDAIMRWFEPGFAAIVGVSECLERKLRSRYPHRTDDIARIWNAVRVPPAPASRRSCAGRALKIVYAGRLDHEQKRVGALIEMSDVLASMGIAHELMFIGDGPAAGLLREAASVREDRIRLGGAVTPDRVGEMLDDADIFVMASRMEGLSFSMLEAMAHGCAVVTTRTESGASEAVEDGSTGVLVDAPDKASDAAVGAELANGVRRAMDMGTAGLGARAWQRAQTLFSLEKQADATIALLRRCVANPPKEWPTQRSWAFSPLPGQRGASGVVPQEGAERLEAALARTENRRIAVHGAGTHTQHLLHVLAPHRHRIAAFTDDNPAAWGFRVLDRPVIAPSEARALGVTDVVLSSAIHEDVLWRRRAVYERQNICVHRVYASASDAVRGARPAHRIVASVHGPDVLSGVTTWGARMAMREGAGADWRMIVVGERIAIDGARSSWPHGECGVAHFIAWEQGSSSVDRIRTVARALADMRADCVVGNYVPEGYAAGALLDLPTLGVAHAQHAWYREVLGRARTGLDAWWAVSAGARDRSAPGLKGVPSLGLHSCGVPMGSMVPIDADPLRPIRVLYAGRLENVEKRVLDLHHLADAMVRRGVRFELRVAGDGPARADLEHRMAEHLQSACVRMLGGIGMDGVDAEMRRADVVVLTSAREGMPVVVMEAMRHGRALAITEGCGDAVAAVRAAACGIVVPVGAMDVMAEGLAAWSRDRASLRAAGTRAHACGCARFDLRSLSGALDGAIESVCAHRIGRTATERWDAVRALAELIGECSPKDMEALAGMLVGAPSSGLDFTLPGQWRMEERLMREAIDRARSMGHHRIALFPCGRHTARLGRALHDAGEVVAIIDEDASMQAEMHGRRVVRPAEALAMGIDCVILSSDQHEAALMARARGWNLPVLGLYTEPDATEASSRPTAA